MYNGILQFVSVLKNNKVFKCHWHDLFWKVVPYDHIHVHMDHPKSKIIIIFLQMDLGKFGSQSHKMKYGGEKMMFAC
jgi:hypothetical protein